MNCTTPVFSDNELLSTLPPAEVARLRPLLTRVRLVNGQSLHEAGQRIGQVFFVEQGFVSMVAQGEGASNGVEVGLPVLLGPEASYNWAMVKRLPA